MASPLAEKLPSCQTERKITTVGGRCSSVHVSICPWKCVGASCLLRETKTRGSLSQRCLSRTSGKLTVLVSARRDFSWRSMWLISAGLFLQQRPFFLCCKNSCNKSPWGAIWQSYPLYLPQQLSWNISAATVQGSSIGVWGRGISRYCNTLI